jgi:hypothetical protein
MKTITFYVEHFSTSEMSVNIPDEVWTKYSTQIDEGGSIEDVFDDLISSEEFHFKQGNISVSPALTAYDYQVGDCDCNKNENE